MTGRIYTDAEVRQTDGLFRRIGPDAFERVDVPDGYDPEPRGRDPLAALVADIARKAWQDFCWLIRTTRKQLRDDR